MSWKAILKNGIHCVMFHDICNDWKTIEECCAKDAWLVICTLTHIFSFWEVSESLQKACPMTPLKNLTFLASSFKFFEFFVLHHCDKWTKLPRNDTEMEDVEAFINKLDILVQLGALLVCTLVGTFV